MSTGLVTNLGLSEIAREVVADGTLVIVQWGGGSGQDETDETLASEFTDTEIDNAATLSQETTNVSGDTIRITSQLSATVPRDVTEVGVFRDPDAMCIYGDFPVISLVAGDAIIFAISVTVS